MSIGLIEQLEQPLRPGEQPAMMAYFFCQNTNYELNTIEGIMKGLVLCLVKQQKDLCEPLRHQWDHDNTRFREDLTSWRALWSLFLEMLDRCKSQRIYIVIDALDECQDNDMAAFLQLVVRTGLNSKVKWLLTSRPFDSAGRELLSASDQVMVSLELNSGHVSKAVKSYIAEKVAWLDRRDGYGPALRKQVETELTKKAEDTYLWVSLVCKRLDGVSRINVLATIEELPPGLTSFYRRIFDKLREGERPVVEASVRLLQVMLTAYRPLREEEVSSATGLSLEHVPVDLLVDRCASFVRKQGASIEFVHQSARDFLAHDAQTILSSCRQWEHGKIALSCLHYLSQQLKVNLVHLPRPDSERGSKSRLPNVARKGPLDKVDYAATFWAQHLADAMPNSLIADALGDQGKVVTFLRAKLLEWFECLSLLDQLPRGLQAMRSLAVTTNLWDVGKALRPSKFLGNTLNSHLKCRSKRDIKTSRMVTTLKYSADGRKLVSNVGSFTVGGVAQGIQHGCDSTSLDDLWMDNTWLCCGNMRLLQLASDSEPTSHDTSGDQATVGTSNGLVLVFGIERKRLDVPLRDLVA
ncbi:G-protein beta WD 40 repeat-containing protein [Stemphylium lycopersici]|uniref:G-protein beta WD 40 repeat-containing protein n=1 Tax=Stemphylium lycopersici TaxID=183478 RepID=A0A364N7Y9_STELY|nr:G-protein beta WD 40 repeat-containing protein [Stemphylium lycopersici]